MILVFETTYQIRKHTLCKDVSTLLSHPQSASSLIYHENSYRLKIYSNNNIFFSVILSLFAFLLVESTALDLYYRHTHRGKNKANKTTLRANFVVFNILLSFYISSIPK